MGTCCKYFVRCALFCDTIGWPINQTNDTQKLTVQTFCAVLFSMWNAEVIESVIASVIEQSRPRS